MTAILSIADQYQAYLDNPIYWNNYIAMLPSDPTTLLLVSSLAQAATLGLSSPHELVGTSKNETIGGAEGGGGDRLFGGAGNDILLGYMGQDVIQGDAGNDVIFGGAVSDTIYGNAGQDLIDGGSNIEYLLDENGDVIEYGDDEEQEVKDFVGDRIFGGADFDGVLYHKNFEQYEVYIKSGDEITIIGTEWTDLINSTLYVKDVASGEIDELNDVEHLQFRNYTFVYQGSSVYFRGIDGDDVFKADNSELDLYWANAINGRGGNDEIWGFTAADFLSGDAGDDSLYGMAGSDLITGGLGNDIAHGGGGR
ncbi:MAG: hypothetical protein MRY63_07095 [Neomegalonema sp.]|nr:hypothetical protein [Neomegalonema sp.]